MKSAPAFLFYPERWLAGTASMTDAEQISYLRLLCHQWLMDGLPDDLPALRRLAGKGVTPALLGKFPVVADGKRRNSRLEAIRTDARRRIEAKKRGAAKTNAARWGVNGERHASESLSDHSASRSASRSATIERVDIESLPAPAPVGEVSPTTPLGENSPSGEGIPPPKARPSPADIEARRNADEANAEPLPLSIATMPGVTEFRAAWAEWCDYRTERATTGLKSKRLDWTRRAARNALLEVERVAPAVGLAAITARIRQAMSGTWQGLNLDRMEFAIPPPAKPVDPNKRSWEK